MEAMQSKSKEFNWEMVQQLRGILSLLKEFDLESLLGEEILDKDKLPAIAQIVFSDKAKAEEIATALSNHADKIPNVKIMTDWIQMVSDYPDVVKTSQLLYFNQYLSDLEALFAKAIVVNNPNGTIQERYRTLVKELKMEAMQSEIKENLKVILEALNENFDDETRANLLGGETNIHLQHAALVTIFRFDYEKFWMIIDALKANKDSYQKLLEATVYLNPENLKSQSENALTQKEAVEKLFENQAAVHEKPEK